MTERPEAGSQLRIATILLGLAALVLVGISLTQPVAPGVQSWLNSAMGGADLPPRIGFEEIVDRVKPAVFGVSTKVVEEEADFQNPTLEEFFEGFDKSEEPQGGGDQGEHAGPPEEQPQEPKRPRLTRNEGSGFFISPDGYAVTANHVVERGKSIEITTNEGKRYPGKLVGADSETDIALLKVDGGKDFPYVEIADRSPRIGEWVIAVGNPFGLGGTVTAGIVSAGARDLMSESYSDFIQIDAPVNQGNSGGPTFDIRGKVIGVNSAIFSPTGGSVGIGFAIPAKTVKAVIPQLKQKGMVTRGWMGVQIQDVTPEIADSIGLKEANGALVAEAEPGSPAAKAGITSGDVIMLLDGDQVMGDRELAKRISETAPGTTIELGVIREGVKKALKVKLAQHPGSGGPAEGKKKDDETPKPDSGPANLGLSLAPGKTLGPDTAGVVVTDVEPGGVGAERGLQPGDIIVEVGGKSVKEPADVEKALSTARGKKHNVLARVKSGDSTHFVAMPTG